MLWPALLTPVSYPFYSIPRGDIMNLSPPETKSLVTRIFQRTVDVKPEEVQALLWSCIYFFCVMSAYYVIRPIRDEMGVAGGVEHLPWLFTGTLAGMIALNPPFCRTRHEAAPRCGSCRSRTVSSSSISSSSICCCSRRQGPQYLGRPGLLHLDCGLQSVRRVGVLGLHGRHLHKQSGKTAVRVHRGRRHNGWHPRALESPPRWSNVWVPRTSCSYRCSSSRSPCTA